MSVSRLSGAALAALMLLSLLACSRDNGPTLSAPEAYAQAQAGKLTLIDIRHSDEWRQTGVAPGALRIDMTDAQGEAGFIKQVAGQLGGRKSTPIALLSIAGNRGANAQRVLREAGFTHVYNIKEGMMGSGAGPGWIARRLPVEPCPRC
ncbi:MAG: rhodanese-like domain-containing protein [Hydrogenophilales bacterium]|nr:rhodanese-like domain-containing protein [Hydrogenophilales bacterium]